METLAYKPNTTISAPALITGMPNSVYHTWPESISKSGLDLVDRSPAHYRFREPREPTRGMEIGTAIHTALLEPERFSSEYMLLKEVKDRRQSEYKEAVKTHGSERVLVSGEVDNVVGMQQSVYAQTNARRWLEAPGYSELSGFAIDPVTGVMIRVRFDRLTTTGDIVDIKKTQDARAEAFERSIINYRYHVQAAFYMDAYEWITGERAESFRFLAVEEKMPHAAMVYRIDDIALAEGRALYRANLNRYAECINSNDWPAYENQEDDLIGLPEWRLRQIENELEVNLD